MADRSVWPCSVVLMALWALQACGVSSPHTTAPAQRAERAPEVVLEPETSAERPGREAYPNISAEEVDGTLDLEDGVFSYQGQQKKFRVETERGAFGVEGGNFRLESEPGGSVLVLPIAEGVTVSHAGDVVVAAPNEAVRLRPDAVSKKLFVTVISR